MIAAVAASILGLTMLAFASDFFVVGAARVATELHVPRVIVGAIVVGFGTSAPEVVVSVLAVANGETALGVGNVIGSNVANLTLVLGTAALVTPVVVSSATLRREVPLSTFAVCLFAACTVIGLALATGLLLLAAMAVALVIVARSALRERGGAELEAEVDEFIAEGTRSGITLRDTSRTIVGLAGTIAGAQLLVWGGATIAVRLGLSEGFVGITIVAIGTSLPELVTAAQAARRGEDELIVGNVLGSNLFNSLAAGGLIGLTAGRFTPSGATSWGLLLMVFTAVAAWIVMARTGRVTPREAVTLMVLYAATLPLLAGA